MYEVFLNDRRMRITAPGKITLNKPSFYFHNEAESQDVKEWFLSFIHQNISEVILTSDRPEHFFPCIFQKAFKMIQAAGGIVIRNQKLLFINRNQKWDIPKGKIDKGETAKEAALREVGEECGIKGHTIIKKLPTSYHIFQSPFADSLGEWILKETFWFEMEYTGTENGKPQLEENITDIKWFSQQELKLPLQNTYANLKELILPYCD